MKKLLSIALMFVAALTACAQRDYPQLPVGSEAPEFTLPDPAGKQVSLSSLRGKWVVLDFWGSWCGWCIKGFPQMKEAHKELGKKITFVGVDCRDSEEAWKAAIKQYELPWLNLRADNDVVMKIAGDYKIAGFPTKLIIDPKGKVQNVTIGEDPAFYTTLRELVK